MVIATENKQDWIQLAHASIKTGIHLQYLAAIYIDVAVCYFVFNKLSLLM